MEVVPTAYRIMDNACSISSECNATRAHTHTPTYVPCLCRLDVYDKHHTVNAPQTRKKHASRRRQQSLWPFWGLSVFIGPCALFSSDEFAVHVTLAGKGRVCARVVPMEYGFI